MKDSGGKRVGAERKVETTPLRLPCFDGIEYNRVTEWSRGESAAAANWRANDPGARVTRAQGIASLKFEVS